MRLVGRTHFFVLQRGDDLASHSVAVYQKFDDAATAWRPGNRISPVFPLNEASPPSFREQIRSWILFFGPIHPGELEATGLDHVFMSLGVFNIVVFCETEASRDLARTFADSRSLQWELWGLLGNRLTECTFAPPAPGSMTVPRQASQPLPAPHEGLIPTIREYRALMLNCITRSQIFTPDITGQLLQFDRIFRQVLKHAPTTDVVKLGSLVIANAALSRFSSQTFCGTSPIVETEAHFWTHSLLGIGTATLALIRTRQFVDDALTRARFAPRLRALSQVAPHPVPLLSLRSTDTFWEEDHLFKGDPTPLLEEATTEAQDYLPLITFLSGRDGFRSTEFSLSAPLEVVSSCNSVPWTLQTLTHEISHTVVESILAVLAPNPNNLQAVDAVLQLLHPDSRPPNLFSQLQAFLLFGIWQMSTRDDVVEEDIPAADLAERMKVWWSELREIVTHVFDFLYFYAGDGASYIRAVWVSWDVIPNIQHRIREYLIRCLCALHSNNIKRGEEGVQITGDQLLEFLRDTHAEFTTSAYLPRAISELENYRDYYLGRLRHRLNLVRLVRYFLYSPEIQRLLRREPVLVSGESGSYDLRPDEFTTRRPANPLHFISHFSTDKKGDGLRAAWMLTQLAFREKR